MHNLSIYLKLFSKFISLSTNKLFLYDFSITNN